MQPTQRADFVEQSFFTIGLLAAGINNNSKTSIANSKMTEQNFASLKILSNIAQEDHCQILLKTESCVTRLSYVQARSSPWLKS